RRECRKNWKLFITGLESVPSASLILRGLFVFIAQLLIVLTPALIAANEWFFHVFPRVLSLDVFESSVHRCRNLIEFHATRSGVHCGLEPKSKEFLVCGKT